MELEQSGHQALEAALGLAWVSQSGCHSVLRLLWEREPEEIWRAPREVLLAWGVATRVAEKFGEARRGFRASEALALLNSAGLRFVPFGSGHFPRELGHLVMPPAGLFVRGSEEAFARLLGVPRVTIVGTRKATTYGLRAAEAFASAFAERGVAVVSGMALGVDARAQDSAIKRDGLTAAVLGCGADIVYPSRNRGLYDKTLATGVILSELPPGAPPARWTFPHRNRLLAGLGDAVLVVEASLASGALQTAGWALELGRPVFVVPGSIYVEGHKGCNLLLRDGAMPAVDPIVTVEDFLLQTRIERGDRQPCDDPSRVCCGVGAADGAGLERDRRRESIIEALASGPASVDELCLLTDLAPRELSAALAELEIVGSVDRAGPGMYIRAP